tara:strand:+ start:2202 stop:2513 length:312 start_codon:yes stop_codon:yes gene_type:complete
MDNQTTPISLVTQGKFCMLANAQGQILIFHEDELPGAVMWVEYEQTENKLFLVYEDHPPQEVGILMDKKLQANISNGTEVRIGHVQDKKFISGQFVNIVIKDY